MGREISLVLSGGGARGAFHLGILQALNELKIEVMEISGASIGAIIGAFYLAGKSPIEIFEFFDSGKFRKTLKFNFRNKSLFKIDLEHPFFDEMLGGVRNIEELPKPLYVSVTNLEKGIVSYQNSGDIKKLVCASGALYPVFGAVDFEGDRLIDGGAMDNFPIFPLRETPYPLLGSNLHPNVYKPNQSIFSRAFFLACFTHGMEEKRKRCDYYLSPDALAYHNILKLKNTDKLFTLGYDEAKKILAEPSVAANL